MKIKVLVCKNCNHTKRIETYSPQELRERNLYPEQPRCEKCGSGNVTMFDPS